VGEFPGFDQGRIAETIGVDRSTIGPIVGRLIERKLLRASAGKADRRTKVLTITPSGRAIVAQLLAKLSPVRTQFLSPLAPAERILFIEMLERLVDAHNGISRAPHRLAGTDAVA
jgi:DNA-binding MarR family transcriptional regulator